MMLRLRGDFGDCFPQARFLNFLKLNTILRNKDDMLVRGRRIRAIRKSMTLAGMCVG
jgi:hypothetical protein